MNASPWTAAILASGDELVDGRRIDTNSSWLQQQLRAAGLTVLETRQVGDGLAELVDAVRDLTARVDVVLATGGLGPTEDDRMRHAVAAAAVVELVEDPAAARHVREVFARLGRTASPSNLRQALFPAGADLLPNHHGTAPGFGLRLGRARLYAMPGVPQEMKAMFLDAVLPQLRPPGGVAAWVDHVLQVVGLPESVLGERLHPWMAAAGPPRVGVTAHEGFITVCLTDRGDAAGRARLRAAATDIRELLKEHCYAEGDETLAGQVVRRLGELGTTVAVAESCTGGMLAAALTDVPGSSEVFLEGCVTYSNAAKVRALGVSEAALQEHGAVSEEVAAQMADGMRQRSGAGYAVATTGIAGPGGGTPEKPVGLVFVAVAGPDGAGVQRLMVHGDRDGVRRRTVVLALDLLRRRLGAGTSIDGPRAV